MVAMATNQPDALSISFRVFLAGGVAWLRLEDEDPPPDVILEQGESEIWEGGELAGFVSYVVEIATVAGAVPGVVVAVETVQRFARWLHGRLQGRAGRLEVGGEDVPLDEEEMVAAFERLLQREINEQPPGGS